jgi:cytochrome P450
MSFMIAGRDTTAATLTFLFHLLATNPAVQAKLLAEIDAKIPLNGSDKIDFNTLSKLVYLEALIKEVLRLHPPVPLDPKFCVHADTLPSGVKIPARTIVAYQPYVMGRDPDLWPDPEQVVIGLFIARTSQCMRAY